MIRKVAVIMGSDSDWPVVKGACSQLKALGIPFEAHILSAHRTPAEAAAFAKSAKDNGFGVILCAAGMAAQARTISSGGSRGATLIPFFVTGAGEVFSSRPSHWAARAARS